MELSKALSLSKEIIDALRPYCKQISIAGSVRRWRPRPNDLDIVIIPDELLLLEQAIQSLGPYLKHGPKISSITYKGHQVDFYFATEETWATLFLIRTGSKEHNIELAKIAKAKGWHLKADGEGLFNEKVERIAGDDEESIFRALGVPYLPPEKRG